MAGTQFGVCVIKIKNSCKTAVFRQSKNKVILRSNLKTSFILNPIFLPASLLPSMGALCKEFFKAFHRRPFSFMIVMCLILVCGTISDTIAQEKWSLQRCVDHSIQNNLQIKQSLLNLDMAGIKNVQNKASFLPSANASATHNYNFGRNIDPVTNIFTTDQINSNSFNIGSNLPLFNGLILHNNYKQGKVDVLTARYDHEKMRDDISMAVIAAYLQILYSRESESVALAQLEGTRQQRDRSRKMFEAGGIAKGALLEMDAQVALEESQFVNSQNLVNSSVLNLMQLLELENVTDFDVEKPPISVPPVIASEVNPFVIFSQAETRLPEIRAADSRVKSAGIGVAIARGSYLPRIGLNSGIGTNYSSAAIKSFFNPEKIPFKDQLNENYYRSLGFSLSVPLLNGLQSRSSVERAKIGYASAEINAVSARNQLRKTIQQSHADVLAAVRIYETSLKSLDAARENFEFVKRSFDLGAAAGIDYTNAKNRLGKTESDLLRAKYDYVFKLKILDFYRGEPIGF
jgi:outer membrane protein